MEEVKLEHKSNEEVIFFIEDEEKKLAKLEVLVDLVNSDLIAFAMTASGRNEALLRSKLFKAMINYAREHYLEIIAIDSFVHNKLKENPNQYANVWDDKKKNALPVTKNSTLYDDKISIYDCIDDTFFL